MSLDNKLKKIIETKNAIKLSINSKGGTLTNEPFSQYPSAIENIKAGGGGGATVNELVDGLTVGQVSNVALSKSGVLTYTAPSVEYLTNAGFNVSLSYLIVINGNSLTTTNTIINIFSYLMEGNNEISVTVKASLASENEKNGGAKQETIIYSFQKDLYCEILSTTLPSVVSNSLCATYGKTAYILGGYDAQSGNKIIKFDLESETLITLSTTLPYGFSKGCLATTDTSIYIFGGRYFNYSKTIIKFDILSETVTTLSTTLPYEIYRVSSATYGRNAYIFGGLNNNYINTIIKFDLLSETVTTLSTTLPGYIYDSGCATYGENAYIFGGYYRTSRTKTIIKFDLLSETVTTLSTTLPYAIASLSSVINNTNIYIFGGNIRDYSDKIIKFDILSETVTTLSTPLPYGVCSTSCATYGENAYIFGGYDLDNYISTIIKATNLS